MRSLSALRKTASTSRVLNLLAIAEQHRATPQHRASPFFLNSFLNESIITKHHLRPDERFVFSNAPHLATKVIIPFDRTDLDLGGKSFFIGQKGWKAMVQGFEGWHSSAHRDIDLLAALDAIPSLDPFILREHLVRKGFQIADAYFSISAADASRMQDFVVSEINQLMTLAFPHQPESDHGRMATALLSNRIDERLGPLQHALRLDADTFRQGIFSWKGFLYYKWALSELAPKLARVMKELPQLRGQGPGNQDLKLLIEYARSRLLKAIRRRHVEIREAIQVYDRAFEDLTRNNKPAAFRDFLSRAPTLFMILGERIGSVSHLASFWQHRFTDAESLLAPIQEVFDLLIDFDSDLSFSEPVTGTPGYGGGWINGKASA